MAWEEAKAKLKQAVEEWAYADAHDNELPSVEEPVSCGDAGLAIRAALQRVEELEKEKEATRERLAYEQRQHHEFMALANGFRAAAHRFAAGEISGTKLGELLFEPDPVAFGRGLQSTLEDESRTRAEAAEAEVRRLEGLICALGCETNVFNFLKILEDVSAEAQRIREREGREVVEHVASVDDAKGGTGYCPACSAS